MSDYFKTFSRNVLFFFLACASLIILTGCLERKTYKPEHISGVVWATQYNVTINNTSGLPLNDIGALVTRVLNGVDSVANVFNPDSEISRLNRDGRLHNPSADFVYLYEESMNAHSASHGAFDPTVGPIVDYWGFGTSDSWANLDEEVPDSLLRLLGMWKIGLKGNDFFLANQGMRLDFSAIAKGYGVDKVAKALKEVGINDYMVEIGGEVRVSGTNPRGKDWSIQIDAPIPDIDGLHTRLAVISLRDAAVATSGNYRNFRIDENGKMTSHTISPLTGKPTQTDILSATVIAADCTIADALATATMVLGLEEARKMIYNLQYHLPNRIFGAIFVTDSGNVEEPFAIDEGFLKEENVTLQKE